MRRTGILSLLIPLLALPPTAASAQRREPWVTAVTRPAGAAERDTTVLAERASTFGERALFGLLASVGATFGMVAAYRNGPPAEIFVPSYALASVLGVELASLPHEGARPVGALIGAAAGTALGFLALGSDCNDCEDPPWFGIIAYTLAVPLAAAAGHGVESRARGYRPPALPEHVQSGVTLRVERVDGTRASGQVLELSDSTIALRRWVAATLRGTVYDTLALRLDSIGRAWIRRGTNWQHGVVIGAALGAGLGFSTLAFDNQDQAGTAAAASTLLALLGGVLGGVVGSANSRWQTTPWPPPAANSLFLQPRIQ